MTPGILESSKSSGGEEAQGVPLNSVQCGRKVKFLNHTGCKANSKRKQDSFWTTSNAQYSGGLGKGAAYRPPYMQDDSADEGCYEHPQQMRLYASTVTQSVLPLRAEYVQYAHPVDEVLLQRLERAQRFQHVQYNKKLAAKKASKAKAETALQHRAINDFLDAFPMDWE
ncbi:hypothetical protein C0995_010302 [Termitomyces sp. Mi166|nr:hypothetical protein C0995_010302 [Termitomyces sp. Mi166\